MVDGVAARSRCIGVPAFRRLRLARSDRRAATALQFAIISIPFFLWVLFIFELSYDLFTQVALDNALSLATREIQTGNAQYLQNGQAFINNYLCPALNGRLECANLYVNVSSPSFGVGQDYYNFTTGAVPSSGGNLVLSSFSGTTSFCNAQPSQFVLVTVVYVGPSFVGSILPGVLSLNFNGSTVHATLSTAGVVTEPYTPGSAPSGSTPAAGCA